MSTIKVNELDTRSGTTITVAAGKTIAGTDIIDTAQISADAVTSTEIADDAVTTAKLANSINTEITANTAKVTNATHTGDVTGATALTIADNAVSLAKMAGLTRGSIITGDASGDPSALAIGTNTHILTSTGTDAAWTAPAASGTANQPNFQMYCSTGVQWSSSAYIKVPYDNLVFESDNGSCDVSTNRRFTVPAGKGGKYVIQTRVRAPSGGNGYMKILVNTLELTNMWLQWASDWGGSKVIYCMNVVELDAADYLEWWVYSSGGGTASSGQYAAGWRLDT